ncbi:hypothetical protein [Streptomyces sp. NPDC001410]|uniref:hypothetical protein n=1 Tax=Streptomyces sp. NPDC001410 TaxID=3364574 RepID=UPI0036BD0C05
MSGDSVVFDVIKGVSRYAQAMEPPSHLAHEIAREALRLEALLAGKTIRLTPAAMEDLRASLRDIREQLSHYNRQLATRYFDPDLNPIYVQVVVRPYQAERIVPLGNGGFLAFAEAVEDRLDLPRSGGDEAGSTSNEIPVSVYIASDDEGEISRIIQSVQELANALGYEEVGEPEVRRGSIFRRSRAAAQVGMDELKSRLSKVERGLELAHLELRQAEVNTKESEAVSNLLTALEGTERACVQIGSVFLVKYVANGRQVVLVRNLTQLEMHALTTYPEILTRPEAALQALATAMSSLPDMEGNGDGDTLTRGTI